MPFFFEQDFIFCYFALKLKICSFLIFFLLILIYFFAEDKFDIPYGRFNNVEDGGYINPANENIIPLLNKNEGKSALSQIKNEFYQT